MPFLGFGASIWDLLIQAKLDQNKDTIVFRASNPIEPWPHHEFILRILDFLKMQGL